MMLILLCILTGCKDEMMESDDGRPVFAEGKGYIALKIVAAAGDGGVGTRADSPWNGEEESDEFFDAGSEDESVLTETPGSHYAFLFDGDKFHSATELEYRETDHELKGESGSFKEKVIGTFLATVDLKDGESSGMPDKCLVVLNARPARIDELKSNMAAGDRKLPDEETVPASDAQYILAMLTRQLTDSEIKATGSNVALFTPGGSGERSVNYCTMSSTTYVEGEGKPQTGKVRTMTDITEGLAATREEAEGHPLVVHVERLSAKVEVGITGKKEEFGNKDSRPDDFWQGGPQWPVVLKPKEGDKLSQVTDNYGSDNPTVEQTDWACILWGWGTNALARREYVFKNLDDVMQGADKAKTGTPFHDASEAKINTPFFANWNDAERHRSYWAVDGYYADPAKYPYQYRKSYDSKQSTYWDKFIIDSGKRSSESPLFYYSYQEIRLRAMGYDPFGSTDPGENHVVNGNLEGSRKYRYIPENVLGAELLKNDIHLAASTHVIFIGQLIMGDELTHYSEELGKEQSAAVMDWVSDKYKSGGYWYDKAGYLRKAYSSVFEVLNGEKRTFPDIFGTKESLSTPEGTVTLSAVKGSGSPVRLDSEYMKDKVAGSADIEKDDNNPFQLVSAEIANGDGRVILGLKEGWKLIVEGGTRMEIEPAQFKSMVYAFGGYADCYRNGRMYYYSPIRHARASAKLDAKDYQVGDIGVVRNHWYKINVNSVIRPGIPVEDPGQPIIPNIDPADQYLALDIHVVPWHVVDQTIDLQ